MTTTHRSPHSSLPAPLDRPLASLPDPELKALSRRLGRAVHVTERRFLATLPEIARRGLYAPRFPSVHAYARRVAGRSRESVDRVLALDRRLAPFPSVHRLLESGEVGWSLLARVPVKELETDPEGWARLLRTCSKAEIDTMLRARRGEDLGPTEANPSAGTAPQPTLPGPLLSALGAVQTHRPGDTGGPRPSAPEGTPSGVHHLVPAGATHRASPTEAETPRGLDLRVTLDPVREARLRTLVRERERETGRPLSLAAFLLELLDEAWAEPGPVGEREPDPATLSAMRERAVESAEASRGKQAPPRVVRFVRARARGKCEASACTRPGEPLHHEAGRRIPVPHHPDRTWLLCLAHHGLRHLGRIANPGDPPPRWRILPTGDSNRSGPIDRAYQRTRRRARDRIVTSGRPAFPLPIRQRPSGRESSAPGARIDT